MTNQPKEEKITFKQIEEAIDNWSEQSAKDMLKECLRKIFLARPDRKNWSVFINDGADEAINKEANEKFSALHNIPTPGWVKGERQLFIKQIAELNAPPLRENLGKARRFIDEVDHHIETQLDIIRIDPVSIVEEREQLEKLAATLKKLCRQIERSGVATKSTLIFALQEAGHPELAEIRKFWMWAKHMQDVANTQSENMRSPAVTDQMRGGQPKTYRDMFILDILKAYRDRFECCSEQLQDGRSSGKKGGIAYTPLVRYIIRFCELAGLYQPGEMQDDSMKKVIRRLEKELQE